LHLHFYASLNSINGINDGHEMLVKAKEMKGFGDIHVSFDMTLYVVKKVTDASSLYKVKKK
jgi:hypothetical protein